MPHLRLVLALFVFAANTCASVAFAKSAVFELPIGDPARSGRQAPVVLDGLTDTATGEVVTPADLAARLATVRLLFVGESHTNTDFHLVQLRVIEELLRAGRKVRIGLEMYPYPQQVFLDQWSAGQLTEAGFLELSRWYENWGYHWSYYRDIFLLARDRGLPMFALNAPREVVSAVRKKGFKDLTAEEAAHIPTQIDTTSAEHRRLFRAFFEDNDALHSSMDEAQWNGMFEAQCTWDATMAFHAIKGLEAKAEPGDIMVVLIGFGHVAYGLGLERQARQWFPEEKGRMASLIPVPVVADGKPRTSVTASFANYLWGVPEEGDPLYPELGISTLAVPGKTTRRVIQVEEGSPAEAAGFAEGDVLVSLDGQPLKDRETFNRLMAGKRWGDAATVAVERGADTVVLRVLLRRTAEETAP